MIIDFHTHVFPDKIAEKTVAALEKNGNTPAFSNGRLDGLMAQMEKAGVDISVNLPVLTKPSQFDSILSFAKEINEAANNTPEGEKKIISFAGIHPDCEDYKEKLYRVKESGILGIKIHPDYQGTFIDDERYVNILAEAKRLGLITVTHAGLDGAYIGERIKCTPRRVLRLLDKIGGYDKLVLAHLGGHQLFSKAYRKLAGKDVYFDTAYILRYKNEKEFRKMVEKHGDDKILFATDSPWRSLKTDIEILKGFSLGEETEKRIFSENARALLKI